MEESDGGLWFFLLSKCVQTHELVSSAMTEDICKEGTTGDLLETLFHYIHTAAQYLDRLSCLGHLRKHDFTIMFFQSII